MYCKLYVPWSHNHLNTSLQPIEIVHVMIYCIVHSISFSNQCCSIIISVIMYSSSARYKFSYESKPKNVAWLCMLAWWVRIVLNPYLRAWRKKNLHELQFDGVNSNSVNTRVSGWVVMGGLLYWRGCPDPYPIQAARDWLVNKIFLWSFHR